MTTVFGVLAIVTGVGLLWRVLPRNVEGEAMRCRYTSPVTASGWHRGGQCRRTAGHPGDHAP